MGRAHGYRVIVPYFRGYGATTFLSSSTPRNVDQVAFALDILALMDVLKIEKAIMTGYLITNLAAQKMPLPPAGKVSWRYQYYFDTERSVLGLTQYRHDPAKVIWTYNSPTWKYSEATFNQTAAAFNNPDYVSIVIGNYRWRQSLAPSEPEYADIENRLQQAPVIAVPSIPSTANTTPSRPGNGAAYRDKFAGKYEHRVFKVGHNVPQEAPRAFAQAVIDADRL